VIRSEHEALRKRLPSGANARTRAAKVCVFGAIALLAGACGRQSGLDHAPGVCVNGLASERVADLRAALVKAPGLVRLPGGTRISDCLAHDSSSGDIQTVGSTLLSVTQDLVDASRRRRSDVALTQLGYLIGAAHRGAAGAQGVADEVVRRLDQEVEDADLNAPAYRTGERAGRAGG
jgi:hypothetical protein